MAYSSNPQNAPLGWVSDYMTMTFTHRKTKIKVTWRMVQDHGFPPPDIMEAAEVEPRIVDYWYEREEAKQGMNILRMNQLDAMIRITLQALLVRKTSTMSWHTGTRFPQSLDDLTDLLQKSLKPKVPTELLLCVESFIVRIPKYQISVVSLEWLHCRTSKDSDWLSCSLVKSPQPIKLWEKDFIVTQIIPPGFDPINEVACGCKLKIVGPIVPNEVPPVRLEDLAVRDVPFFSISEMR